MSLGLVAYGSSDESDSSDTEETAKPRAESILLPKPQNGVKTGIASHSLSDETGNENHGPHVSSVHPDSSTLDGGLRDLPEPKSQTASVIDENDELEDEVKPKASQLADAPKPPPKKTKKPVQITIPALPDSDEEKEPEKKKPKLGSVKTAGKSGLTSLLPAPVHAARKESNRILLPYTLTKRVNPNPTPPTVKKPVTTEDNSSKVKSLTTSLADYGSDSDENEENSDEPVNFFSLGSSSMTKPKYDTVKELKNTVTDLKPVEQTVSLPPPSSRTSLNLPAPVKNTKGLVNQSDLSELGKSASVSDTDPSSEGVSLGLDNPYGSTTDPDAPLSFKGGMSRAYPSQGSSQGPESGGASQQMMYSMDYAGYNTYPEADDEQALQQDEQFLRLQGKKMRGKEAINIVDVNADDFTSPADLSKYISEEQPQQSHRKKDSNMPSHQQKRKHQIQYLAFEAKERELELKNQWSNNKMSRKQTQAKYGF